MKQSMLDNFRIDGVIPITGAQVTTMIDDLKATLLQALHEQGVHQQAQMMAVQGGSTAGNAVSTTVETWTWRGKLHCVPESFRFPR